MFCSWLLGVLAADDAVDDFGARPRDDDVEVFNAGVVFSTGVTSFDGVDARESLSLDAVSVSGFFGFEAGTAQYNRFKYILLLRIDHEYKLIKLNANKPFLFFALYCLASSFCFWTFESLNLSTRFS